jgi:hypothetical protein
VGETPTTVPVCFPPLPLYLRRVPSIPRMKNLGPGTFRRKPRDRNRRPPRRTRFLPWGPFWAEVRQRGPGGPEKRGKSAGSKAELPQFIEFACDLARSGS